MSTLNLIHNTPLIFLDKISAALPGKIYAKAEHLQPGGSVKDRAAYQIILDAYENGSLKKGQTIVEMTSPERRKIMSAFGAEIVLTKQVDGSPGMVTGADIALAVEAANEITQNRNAFYADQFNNPSCIKAHFNHTGPEIHLDLPEIDGFIASVGSGGTFIGTSKYLKSVNLNIKCLVVEPEKSAILKTGHVDDPRHIIRALPTD